MIFTPKDPSGKNPNVPSEHPLKEFGSLILISLALVAAAFYLLGWVAEILAVKIPLKWEQRLFPLSYFLKEEVELKKSNAYLSDLVKKLAVHNPDKRYDYQISLLCSETPNAFALPGGRIVVTSALFETVKSENGLAFVLGHEMAHLAHRDHLRGIGRALVLVGLTALVAGEGTGGVSQMMGNLTDIFSLKFSRDQEAAADNLGLELLVAAYGHAGGAEEFFASMQKSGGLRDYVPEFFSTHPNDDRRIENLMARRKGNSLPLVPLPTFPAECPVKR